MSEQEFNPPFTNGDDLADVKLTHVAESKRPWVVDGVNLLSGRSAIERGPSVLEMPLEETISNWNRIANDYVGDYRHRKDTPNVVIELPMVEGLLNGDIDGKRVLEIGAGDGYFIEQMFNMGTPSEVIALEPSERMVEHMASHISSRAFRDRISIVTRPIESSGLSEPFDIIVAINVLDVVANIDTALAEISRLLPVGGRFVGMIRHPERNRLMALKGTGDYVPGKKSWYKEYWPGTGGDNTSGIWARYMELEQWSQEFGREYLWSIFYRPKPSEWVSGRHPEMAKIYERRPGGLVFDAVKINEATLVAARSLKLDAVSVE